MLHAVKVLNLRCHKLASSFLIVPCCSILCEAMMASVDLTLKQLLPCIWDWCGITLMFIPNDKCSEFGQSCMIQSAFQFANSTSSLLTTGR